MYVFLALGNTHHGAWQPKSRFLVNPKDMDSARGLKLSSGHNLVCVQDPLDPMPILDRVLLCLILTLPSMLKIFATGQ